MSPSDVAAFSNLVDDLTAVVIVAICVIGSFWLIAQIIKSRTGKKLAPAETAMLEQMMRIAERMDSRMNAVERILDADAPTWRNELPTGGGNDKRFG